MKLIYPIFVLLSILSQMQAMEDALNNSRFLKTNTQNEIEKKRDYTLKTICCSLGGLLILKLGLLCYCRKKRRERINKIIEDAKILAEQQRGNKQLMNQNQSMYQMQADGTFIAINQGQQSVFTQGQVYNQSTQAIQQKLPNQPIYAAQQQIYPLMSAQMPIQQQYQPFMPNNLQLQFTPQL